MQSCLRAQNSFRLLFEIDKDLADCICKRTRFGGGPQTKSLAVRNWTSVHPNGSRLGCVTDLAGPSPRFRLVICFLFSCSNIFYAFKHFYVFKNVCVCKHFNVLKNNCVLICFHCVEKNWTCSNLKALREHVNILKHVKNFERVQIVEHVKILEHV